MITDIKKFACAITDELKECLEQVKPEQAGKLYRDIKEADRVFVWAPGRCQAMLRCFIARLTKAGKTAYVVGDTITPAIGEGDLLILASGAGHNIGVASIGERARAFGAKVVLLTIVKESLCQSVSDYVVIIPGRTAACGGIGTSIQPGGGKYEQSMFLLLEAIAECYSAEKKEQTELTPGKLMETAVRLTADIKNVIGTLEEARAEAVFLAVSLAAKRGKRVFVWSFAPRQITLMRCYLMRLMHMGVKAFVWGDTVCPEPEESDIFLVSDASGRDEATKTVIRQMREKGADVFLLTKDQNGRVEAGKELHFKVNERNDSDGTQLFEQSMLILLDAMIAKHSDVFGYEKSAAFKRHANLE